MSKFYKKLSPAELEQLLPWVDRYFNWWQCRGEPPLEIVLLRERHLATRDVNPYRAIARSSITLILQHLISSWEKSDVLGAVVIAIVAAIIITALAGVATAAAILVH